MLLIDKKVVKGGKQTNVTECYKEIELKIARKGYEGGKITYAIINIPTSALYPRMGLQNLQCRCSISSVEKTRIYESFYIGSSINEFERRLYNHLSSLNNTAKRNMTSLSIYFWKLKDEKKSPKQMENSKISQNFKVIK